MQPIAARTAKSVKPTAPLQSLFRQFPTTPTTTATATTTSQIPPKFKWSQMTAGDRATTALGAATTLGLMGFFSSPEVKSTFDQMRESYDCNNGLNPLFTSLPTSTDRQTTLPNLLHLTPGLNEQLTNAIASSPLLSIPQQQQSILASPHNDAGVRRALSQPVTVNGQHWPTYNQYMIAQGAINGTSQFDHTAPYALMGLFAAVTGAYQIGSRLSEPTAVRLEQWFMNNMTLSYDNRAKPWTYITNAMTHFTPFHLLANCMAFNSFSSQVGVLSAPAFFSLFFGLALSSSAIGLGLNLSIARALLRFGKTRPSLMIPSVGASGVIAAMIAICALTNPTNSVSLFGLTPSIGILPALGGLITLDTVGLIAQACGKRSPLSHSGHLGGYISGIALFMLSKEKFERQYQRNTFSYYGNWLENTWHPDTSRNILRPGQDVRNH